MTPCFASTVADGGHVCSCERLIGFGTLNLFLTDLMSGPRKPRTYRIDIDSVRRSFPPGVEVPPLLLDFAIWLEKHFWGSVGCFALVGDFSDFAPIVDGSPLRDKFALFMRLPDGSVAGVWYGGGVDVAHAPIVLLGSEGEYEILAPSLEGFLAKLALRGFDEWCTDLAPRDDVEDATEELADWLAECLGVDDLEPLTEAPSALPDFHNWMNNWCSDREEYWAKHPIMIELGRQLVSHLPEGKKPWDSTWFRIAIVGAQYQAHVAQCGPQPFDEASAIEPWLRQLREEMWHDMPALGLWYSMEFRLHANRQIFPQFDYQTRPTIGDAPAELSEARADLARAPRPERWMPVWLTAS